MEQVEEEEAAVKLGEEERIVHESEKESARNKQGECALSRTALTSERTARPRAPASSFPLEEIGGS